MPRRPRSFVDALPDPASAEAAALIASIRKDQLPALRAWLVIAEEAEFRRLYAADAPMTEIATALGVSRGHLYAKLEAIVAKGQAAAPARQATDPDVDAAAEIDARVELVSDITTPAADSGPSETERGPFGEAPLFGGAL